MAGVPGSLGPWLRPLVCAGGRGCGACSWAVGARLRPLGKEGLVAGACAEASGAGAWRAPLVSVLGAEACGADVCGASLVCALGGGEGVALGSVAAAVGSARGAPPSLGGRGSEGKEVVSSLPSGSSDSTPDDEE